MPYLPKERQQKLDDEAPQRDVENELYLRRHPELRSAIKLLLAKAMQDEPQPHDAIAYAREFFADPAALRLTLQEH